MRVRAENAEANTGAPIFPFESTTFVAFKCKCNAEKQRQRKTFPKICFYTKAIINYCCSFTFGLLQWNLSQCIKKITHHSRNKKWRLYGLCKYVPEKSYNCENGTNSNIICTARVLNSSSLTLMSNDNQHMKMCSYLSLFMTAQQSK